VCSSSRLSVFLGIVETERLPYPHPVRTEIAGEARTTSLKTPSELSGVRRELRAARVQCPTPEGLEAAVAKRDDANREVATLLFFGFCVNVCGWRQSCQVELF